MFVSIDFVCNLKKSFIAHSGANAFCIDDVFYSYQELKCKVDSILFDVAKLQFETNHKRVAIICENNLETYASIIACWFSGVAYIPILSKNPADRNLAILKDAQVGIVLYSAEIIDSIFTDFNLINVNHCSSQFMGQFESHINSSDEAYILFTSGSSGKPKGVPITFANLNSFIENFSKSDFIVVPDDRCLQMFEMTFDVSISSFLPALLNGACVFTVSDRGHKYIDVLRLIGKYNLTSIQIVPSVIKLGIPLLKRVDFTSLKSCILTGEATHVDMFSALQEVAVNASFFDFYGPTECTIYCSCYKIDKFRLKHHNGLLSIGKPMLNNKFALLGDNGLISCSDNKGELLISSDQLTQGYLESKLNSKAFLKIDGKIYYRSGDLCYFDNDGDYLYCGRLDSQVKIQGFRVELGEIEHTIKKNCKVNCIVLADQNNEDFTELILVIESKESMNYFTRPNIFEAILPNYMIPNKILYLEEFPINGSGKTDRNKIKDMISC
jgi:D-alanine--poly(phosphoribitol) ligase subunit 1